MTLLELAAWLKLYDQAMLASSLLGGSKDLVLSVSLPLFYIHHAFLLHLPELTVSCPITAVLTSSCLPEPSFPV